MDATHWVIYPDASSFISRNIRQVASIGNRVYVSDNTGNTFYKDAQTSWTNIISGNTINTINLSSNKLVLTSNSTIYSIDNSYNTYMIWLAHTVLRVDSWLAGLLTPSTWQPQPRSCLYTTAENGWVRGS